MDNITLTLTPLEYQTLINELQSLYGYHWNDDRINADDCGSQIIDVIYSQVKQGNYSY